MCAMLACVRAGCVIHSFSCVIPLFVVLTAECRLLLLFDRTQRAISASLGLTGCMHVLLAAPAGLRLRPADRHGCAGRPQGVCGGHAGL